MNALDYDILHLLNGSDNPIVDSMALILTDAYTWIPLYLMLIFLVVHNNERWSQILLIISAAICCVSISSIISEVICKPWVARLRPMYTPELYDHLDLVEGYSASGFSFFSSHAANTFSLAVFLSMLVRRRTFSMFIITWSLINCWTRLYLGAHFPSDILVGLLCGGIIGLVCYSVYLFFYKKISSRLHFISNQYTSTGYSLTDIDIFLNVQVVIYIVIIICAIIKTVI